MPLDPRKANRSPSSAAGSPPSLPKGAAARPEPKRGRLETKGLSKDANFTQDRLEGHQRAFLNQVSAGRELQPRKRANRPVRRRLLNNDDYRALYDNAGALVYILWSACLPL